ncbi:MAG: peptidoglycan DD-metalloendopeptidase family protein [Saprospiraceae bacterium]|nr:peptidoglycan DD-metalloendopeptidase family protein [Saprospiraceae bacterium]
MRRFSFCLQLFLIFILCTLHVAEGTTQSRKQLEEERLKIIEQIEQTTQNLEATKSNKKATLNDLKAIENQIKSRKQLIANIQEQIKNADRAIATNDVKIDSLNKDLLQLDNQYKQLAKNMYLREMASNKWAYIFSASSVNDAFLRWRYSKQYEEFASKKTNQFTTLRSNINSKTNSIIEEKKYVEVLLIDEKNNYKQLEKDLKKKDEILVQLQKEESTLRKNLTQQKRNRERLNKEIEKIILAELSKAKKKRSESSNSAASASIRKKNLLWPAQGYVSGKFGNQQHPTLKNVKINNNGIDITCKKSASVTVVADGIVIGITEIPGYDNMVIVQHGEYYSVYSKLAKVDVKKQAKLKAGQTLGRLDNSPAPELHFEFWHGKKKLNPQQWLK